MNIDELLPEKYKGQEYCVLHVNFEERKVQWLDKNGPSQWPELYSDAKKNACLAGLLPAAVKALERAFKSLNLAEGPQAAKAYTEQSSPPYKKDKEFTIWVEMREGLAEAQNTLTAISEATKAVGE